VGLRTVLLLLGGAPGAAARNAPGLHTPEDPRTVVRSALRAVEGDSSAPLRARWDARLRADPSDRPAALGLARLDRLTYDYPAAGRRYARLYADTAAPDLVAAYARLGAGQALDTRGHLTEAGEQLERARAAARRVGDARAEGEPVVALSFIRAQAYNLTAQGLNDSASALLREVARLQRRARDHGGLAITLFFATDPHLDTGRYGAAKATLEQALAEAERSRDGNAVRAHPCVRGHPSRGPGSCVARRRLDAPGDRAVRGAAGGRPGLPVARGGTG